MQLPWQPVLLLQWVAGVLTEIYSLRLELVELYRWHLPFSTALAVKRLFKIFATDMPEMTFRALCHVNMHLRMTTSAKPICHTYIWLFLKRTTHSLVPLLEFVTSGKARDIVRALKRLSFGPNFHYGGNIMYAEFANREWDSFYDCMFSSHFWSRGNSSEVIGTFLKSSEDLKLINRDEEYSIQLYGTEQFVMKATPRWIADMENKYGRQIKTEKVIQIFFKFCSLLKNQSKIYMKIFISRF
jgi:hypothetical protein